MQKCLGVLLATISLGITLSAGSAQESPIPVPRALLTVEDLAKHATNGPAAVIMAVDADGTNLRTIGAVPDYPLINSPEVSADGEWIAVDGWNHGESPVQAHLLLVELGTGVVKDLGPGAMPTWSASGNTIAFSRYRTQGENRHGVFIGSIDQKRERLIDDEGWAITFSPDGERVVYVRNNDLVVYNIFFRTGHHVFGNGDSPYRRIMHNPEWSPDGRRICFLGLRDDGTRELATVLAEGPDPDLQVCCEAQNFNPDIGWSKDGVRLTLPQRSMGGKPGQICIIDLKTKQQPTPFPGQPSNRNNHGNDWAPDGKTLYFLSTR